MAQKLLIAAPMHATASIDTLPDSAICPTQELDRRWFRLYNGLVYRRALRLLGSRADAEEVTQEVLIKAFSQREELESAAVKGWLYRVTTNHCLNRLRNEKRRQQIERDDLAPNLRRSAEPMLYEAVLTRWLLARADEREAACATYVYVEDMAHEDVARLMGVSLRTVHNLLRRFRTWARAAVEQPC